MENLSTLDLKGTPIEKLPSSIGHLVGLTFLNVGNCENLLDIPSEICNLKSLEWLFSGNTFSDKSRFWWGLQRKAFVLGSIHGLWTLKFLDLSDCGLCEGDIPVDIGCLSSLEELDLSRNNFVSLPPSIGCLHKLKSLKNEGCDESIILGMLWIAMDWRFLQVPRWNIPAFQIVTPGSRIPEWFNNQSVGDSLIVELPPCTTSIWIAFCAVSEEGAPVDHSNPPQYLSTNFQIVCRPGEGARVRSNPITKGHLVSPHLWPPPQISAHKYLKS
ncbi:hypothetical protein L3X38_012576 [Prunus dulcis]|uniref:Disease resistance protein RPS4B/Roq1-like leucine-rich repeats domain-containing protein n=1 Tax=Prunus dulcis TaxID=3755 RepID=A0AAD4WJV8_PRUDU|nr:hypothetical protein L3X38_012576 [Prunus dulcis]